MSNLRDIMDVDVDPLEAHTYRRSKEAAAQQAASSSASPASRTAPPETDDKVNATVKRRRSNRGSKGVAQAAPSQQLPPTRRRSSPSGEGMDFSPGYQAGGSDQASESGSTQRSFGGSQQGADVPVKYTPVTGRVSRAKKGVPVHTCDICRPVKTFTRAEHLRRHQLSHQKPAYPCTFEDCERAFHRPDLLTRHLSRHETQGEKAYKAGDPRSRASSSASESRTPSLKVETPALGAATATQTSPTDSMTPRTSGGGGGSLTATSFDVSPVSNYQAGPSQQHKRSASQANLPETDAYPTGTHSARSLDAGGFERNAGHSSFDDPYSEGQSSTFSNYTTATPQLPLLRIPEENWNPGLSYTNSPWCSSASDSAYSTQSDGSRGAPHWAHRGRSLSVATLPDWPVPTATQWPSHAITTTHQDLRSPAAFDSVVLERFETRYTPPRMSPPPASRGGQMLGVPNSFNGTIVEAVGTPALSIYEKPLAQCFPASQPRVFNSGYQFGRKKGRLEEEPFQFSQLGADNTLLVPIHQQRPVLSMYITTYWKTMHLLLPIIHQPTFNLLGNDILTSAMAAIGTQYLDTPESRRHGAELNEFCKKSIEFYQDWDLRTMQAILLTEIFTRFRGRKASVRISRHFETIYDKLLNDTTQDRFASSSPIVPHAAGEQFHQPTSNAVSLQSGIQEAWLWWLETEGRRRLSSACFLLDIHQSLYHQQQRCKTSKGITSPVLFAPCPDNIWNIDNAGSWEAQRHNLIDRPLQLAAREPQSQYLNDSPFTQSLITALLAARLPPREDHSDVHHLPPHSMDPRVEMLVNHFQTSSLALTYLMLHHTPLKDLLAISGDTWVFSVKVSSPTAFQISQTRLRIWSSSLEAAQATQYASKILSQALSSPGTLQSPKNSDIFASDYWSIYVSALVCWAFAHRQSPTNSASISRDGSITQLSDQADDSTPEDFRLRALSYTRRMLDFSLKDLLANKASARMDMAAVLDATRHRLKIESVGNKCGLLVDAIVVLGKIKDGGKGKWF